MAFALGDVVGQYRLEQVIARGRATIVFLARDLNLDKLVVVKTLAEAADSRLRRDRFIDEAQTAASLDDHPNIISTLNWGEHDGLPYIVTQYVPGLTLEEVLSRQPGGTAMRPAEALAILTQVASALDSAHRRGVVHRDVKPANIMVRVDEAPPVAYLLDFGITRSTSGQESMPAHGQFVGTAAYASPEQISSAPDIDQRADVYSLACTAFEMLTGAPPFADAADDAARLRAHLQRAVPSASERRSALPAGVDDVFAKALAKDKGQRFATCTELATALRACFPTGELQYVRPGVALSETVVPRPAEPAPWSTGRKALVALLLVALAAASGIGSYLFFRDDALAIAAPTTTSTPTTTTTPPTTTSSATTTATNLYGDVVGAPITDSANTPHAVVRALQSRSTDLGAIAPASPLYYYSQWLRLTTPVPAEPAVATATGYAITADTKVELGGFQAAGGGKLASATECNGDTCIVLANAITVDPACPDLTTCKVFASTTLAASTRRLAALALRPPAVTMLYQLSTQRKVVTVADSTGALPSDPIAGLLALRLTAAPAPETTSVLTLTYDDGSTDELTVTF